MADITLNIFLTFLLSNCKIFRLVASSSEADPSYSYQLFRPVNVSESVWPNFVTRTMTGVISSLIECCAMCHANKETCNGVFFDDSGYKPVCQLSTVHQWRFIEGDGKVVYVKPNPIGISIPNENGAVYLPRATQVQLRTHTDGGSDGDAHCWLYLRICSEDGVTCCNSAVFDKPYYDDYERGRLDTYGQHHGMGGCFNFAVPDFRTAHIYMRHREWDDWGGAYINLWFEDRAWFVKCVNPDGSGKIYINHNDVMELACSPGDINNQ